MVIAEKLKNTEIGLIPEDWEVTTFGTVAECDPEVLSSKTNPDYRFNYIALEDVVRGKLNAWSEQVFATASSRARRLIRQGDILVGTVRPNLQSHLLFRGGSGNWICSTGFCILRPKPKLADSRYLFAHLFTSGISRQIEATIAGSNYPAITRKDVGSLLFPVPPTIDEQKAISDALGDLDALIEVLERLITKKRDIKQAAMQQLLTGKTRLRGFVEEWAEKSLSELFDFAGGFTASRDQLSPDKGLCYLHYGDIHGSAKTFIDVSLEFAKIPKLEIDLKRIGSGPLLRDGDVVFVDASEDDDGTSKYVVVRNKANLPFISGLHTIVAKRKSEELDAAFLGFCFQTSAIQQQFKYYAVGTKVKGVNKTTIKSIKLRFPAIKEQAEIAKILSEMDVELEQLTALLDKTRDIKQGMMLQLLTGKVRLI